MGHKYGNLYWRITYDCNANCFMCLRNHSGKIIKGYEKKLLEGAKNLGFRTIVFTGGEPTIRKDLLKLIHLAKSYGLNARLDTNGILINKNYLSKIKNDLYLLGLPLQASNAKLHDSIVGVKGHFNIIKDRAKIAAELGIPLKITTAVSEKNLHDIKNIADYLAKEIHPKIYAVNGLVKRAMDSCLFNKYCLKKGEFGSIKKELSKSEYPLKISFCSGHKDSNRAYIFVNPDFSVAMPKGETEEFLGDLKTETLESILGRAKINYKLHIKRSKDTSL